METILLIWGTVAIGGAIFVVPCILIHLFIYDEGRRKLFIPQPVAMGIWIVGITYFMWVMMPPELR